MGFFSFIGKALGSVAKIALPLVGGPVGSIAGQLLGHKAPMSTGSTKLAILGRLPVNVMRGQAPVRVGGLMTRPVLRASPVMPGGAVATSQGIMAPGGGVPPATYGGRSSSHAKRRKRRSSSSRRSSHARSGKKRHGGKRLKFGSAAYRRKYLGHRR